MVGVLRAHGPRAFLKCSSFGMPPGSPHFCACRSLRFCACRCLRWCNRGTVGAAPLPRSPHVSVEQFTLVVRRGDSPPEVQFSLALRRPARSVALPPSDESAGGSKGRCVSRTACYPRFAGPTTTNGASPPLAHARNCGRGLASALRRPRHARGPHHPAREQVKMRAGAVPRRAAAGRGAPRPSALWPVGGVGGGGAPRLWPRDQELSAQPQLTASHPSPYLHCCSSRSRRKKMEGQLRHEVAVARSELEERRAAAN